MPATTIAPAARSRRTAAALLACVLLLAPPAGAQRDTRSPAPRRTAVVSDDGHQLALWSKRPATRPRGAILLLHGRTWSALPNFDLQVAGQRVSLMDAFVARGYAVYALDQRGYGATARDGTGFLTPARAAGDAQAALAWIAARERGGRRPVLLGYSQGSLTAMLAAQRDSLAASAIVLYGFPRDVTRSMPPATEPAVPSRRATTVVGAEEDFITPESTPPGVKESYGRAAVAADPVRMDWRGDAEWGALDPAALRVPVLVINGERDPYAQRANLQAFMARVAGVDRGWVVLARADHAAHLERQREFVQAVVAFVETTGGLPARR